MFLIIFFQDKSIKQPLLFEYALCIPSILEICSWVDYSYIFVYYK